jgi:hypothetical protein
LNLAIPSAKPHKFSHFRSHFSLCRNTRFLHDCVSTLS